MKNIKTLFLHLLLSVFLTFTISSCKETVDPAPIEEPEPEPDPQTGNDGIETPFTAIPNELVGTWYAHHNDGPLTTNWEQGTFQGETGFREFRTMVFTKDGKNAMEYTSWVNSSTGNRYMFKRIGTLEYKTNPNSLTFHVQSGKVRLYRDNVPGYQEMDIVNKDWPYVSVLAHPEATTYSSTTNYLSANRVDGGTEYSVKYTKVGTTNPGDGNDNPEGPYTKPPTSGSYIQIANQYYPTVTIGNQEWMSVNLAGNGGMKDSAKPHYGTFYRFMDLKDIPVPAGWRIPTSEDFIQLLKSQNLEFNEYGMVDGETPQTKKLFGQLMATTGWIREDGYATNKSGFNAVPANYRFQEGSPNGEGARCILWTSDLNSNEDPLSFQITQLLDKTQAYFLPQATGYYPPHLPVRLVKDK